MLRVLGLRKNSGRVLSLGLVHSKMWDRVQRLHGMIWFLLLGCLDLDIKILTDYVVWLLVRCVQLLRIQHDRDLEGVEVICLVVQVVLRNQLVI